jgi:outer membrane autotransporter protein
MHIYGKRIFQMNDRLRKRKVRAFQVGTLCALNILFCPTLFAASIVSGANRATMHAVNTKIESKFAQKQAAADNENTILHDSKPYESEPLIFGATQRQKANVAANIEGYHVKTGGVGYLFDYNLQTALDLFEIGGGATYSESHTKITTDTLNSEYGQIIGYANLVQNGYFMGLLLTGSESWNKSKRVIPNSVLEARARFKGTGLFSKIRMGYMTRKCDWQFTPEASLQHVRFHQGGYDEAGADISNLRASASSAAGTRAGIGGRVTYIQPTVTTEVRAFYLRDLKNPLLKPNFAFISSGGVFLDSPQNNKKNSLNLGTTLRYFVCPDLSIAGNYDYLRKQLGYTENNVSLSMTWNF